MNLTKNQIYIISAVVIVAIVYFMFFRKKTTSSTANKMATPPAGDQPVDPNPGESGYYGNQFGWNAGTNPLYTTYNQAMGSVDGNASNSVAGMLGESGYYASQINNGVIESNYAANAINESNYAGAWNVPMNLGSNAGMKNWETN